MATSISLALIFSHFISCTHFFYLLFAYFLLYLSFSSLQLSVSRRKKPNSRTGDNLSSLLLHCSVSRCRTTQQQRHRCRQSHRYLWHRQLKLGSSCSNSFSFQFYFLFFSLKFYVKFLIEISILTLHNFEILKLCLKFMFAF